MKGKMTSRILIIIGGIIILLILTNPTNKQYTEFLKTNGYELSRHYSSSGGDYFEPFYGKKFNFFIFSTFRYQEGKPYVNYIPSEEAVIKRSLHIGVLSNFWELKSFKIVVQKTK